jgi:5-methylcytosine-specific restriction endonuclease McrA
MPCAACGSTGDIHIDHIIPVSRGGTSQRDNLQPLCYWCNGIKGNRLMSNAEILQRHESWRRA